MLIIYTTPSCSSCRKAKKWLDEHRIKYIEKNIFNEKITIKDIDAMLERAENGFEDIISTRSKVVKECNVDLESMTTNELKKFIAENPSILKRPIMIDEDKMQVGYNDEEIRVFIPKRLREIIMETRISDFETDPRTPLERYIDELEGRE